MRVSCRLVSHGCISIKWNNNRPFAALSNREELDGRLLQRTFIARDLRANDIADLAAGGKIRNYNVHLISTFLNTSHTFHDIVSEDGYHTAQISRNTRSEQPARRHGQRTAEVDHAGEGAAVEDVEAVLTNVKSIVSNSFLFREVEMIGRTVCSFLISSSKLTVPGRAAVTRSYMEGCSVSVVV